MIFSSGYSTFTSSGSNRRDMPNLRSATVNALFKCSATNSDPMDQNRVSRSGFGMFCPDSDPKPDSNLLYLHGLFDIKNVAGPGQNNLDLPNCSKAQ